MRRRRLPLLAGLGVALLLHVWAIGGLGLAAPAGTAPVAAPRPVLALAVAPEHTAPREMPPAVAPLVPAVLLASADPPVSLPVRAAMTSVPVATPSPGRKPRPAPLLPQQDATPVAPVADEPAAERHASSERAPAMQDANDAAPADAAPAQAAPPRLPDGLLLAAAATATPAALAAPPAAPAIDVATAPTYRTRIPAAARVDYRLSRGAITGSGEIDWQPQAGSYVLRLEGRVPIIGTLITQTSRGGFDAAGLAPERYTDRRLRRGEQAANFQRAAGRISFSGQSPELPLMPGVQDRLSVMLQLAAIANAWNKPPLSGEHLRIQVVGARGDSHVWSLRFEGVQPVETPGGSVRALRFLREPENPQDTRAEFWLDPARQYLPVRARLTDGSSDAFELLRVN
ncbi:DUF3108 domain-containing protein [Methylibium sp.]|uniref:DUF3108 domain-containing protein n=1 Tax=Methylibium sp. TaxID=2067992 RepID=UPI003D0D1E7E